MAKMQFRSDIDLNGNQLIRAIQESVKANPPTVVDGQIIFNTVEKKFFMGARGVWTAIGDVTGDFATKEELQEGLLTKLNAVGGQTGYSPDALSRQVRNITYGENTPSDTEGVDGDIWVSPGSVTTMVDWGNIEGDITQQTDLTEALSMKLDAVGGKTIYSQPVDESQLRNVKYSDADPGTADGTDGDIWVSIEPKPPISVYSIPIERKITQNDLDLLESRLDARIKVLENTPNVRGEPF